jgi:hypothetical protein
MYCTNNPKWGEGFATGQAVGHCSGGSAMVPWGTWVRLSELNIIKHRLLVFKAILDHMHDWPQDCVLASLSVILWCLHNIDNVSLSLSNTSL